MVEGGTPPMVMEEVNPWEREKSPTGEVGTQPMEKGGTQLMGWGKSTHGRGENSTHGVGHTQTMGRWVGVGEFQGAPCCIHPFSGYNNGLH